MATASVVLMLAGVVAVFVKGGADEPIAGPTRTATPTDQGTPDPGRTTRPREDREPRRQPRDRQPRRLPREPRVPATPETGVGGAAAGSALLALSAGGAGYLARRRGARW